jgi:hypothetical protein
MHLKVFATCIDMTRSHHSLEDISNEGHEAYIKGLVLV